MWSVYFSIFRIYFSSPIVFFRFLIQFHDYRFDLALVVFAIKGLNGAERDKHPKIIFKSDLCAVFSVEFF
jgi:hypothetical protein